MDKKTYCDACDEETPKDKLVLIDQYDWCSNSYWCQGCCDSGGPNAGRECNDYSPTVEENYQRAYEDIRRLRGLPV